MKDDSWKDELLSDVLAEAAPPSLRAGTLDRLLVEAQRRRRQRQRTRVLLAAACMVFVIGLTMKFVPGKHQPIVVRIDPLLVHSRPLVLDMVVTTQAGLVPMMRPSSSSVVLVAPIPAEKLFELISDDQLLALLAGRPAALVHHGASTAELVFLNPADADGFQVD